MPNHTHEYPPEWDDVDMETALTPLMEEQLEELRRMPPERVSATYFDDEDFTPDQLEALAWQIAERMAKREWARDDEGNDADV